MLHQIVFIKPNLHQAVITAPAIRMNHGAGFHMAADEALQRGFGAVRHDLGLVLTLTLQEPEQNRFAIRATTALATNPMGIEVRFLDFYRTLQLRFHFARIINLCLNLQLNTTHRSDRNPSQFDATGGSEI